MKFSTTVAALSAAALASAQTSTSRPFNLVSFSQFGPFNNQKLGSCHSGAAIESICLEKNDTAVFGFNYTTPTGSSGSGVKGDSVSGTLTFSAGSIASQGMELFLQPSTNVAQAIFGLGTPTQVAFDQSEYLNIVSGYNDVVSPPTFGNGTAYYRWQICETNFEGYRYDTLNWVYGDAKPQNPSCHPVSVKRVYASSGY